MNVRGAIIMLVLLMGIGGFWYFHDLKGGEAREEAKTREEQLLNGVKAEDIVSLHWTGKSAEDERFYSRKDGKWLLSVDGAAELASLAETGDLCTRMAELKYQSVIKENPVPGDLVQYGLDKPEATLEIAVASGSPIRIFQGSTTPDEYNRYVYTSLNPNVVTVPADWNEGFRKLASEMRENSVLPMLPNDVSAVSFFNMAEGSAGAEKPVLSLQKAAAPAAEKEDGKAEDQEPVPEGDADWTVTPAGAPAVRADATKVNDYLWALREAKVLRFLHPDEFAKFGNACARMDFLSAKDGHSVSFEVGDSDVHDRILEAKGEAQSQENLYYVRRHDPEEVMIVKLPDEDANLLNPVLSDWEDRHLAAVNVNAVHSLEISWKDPQKGEQHLVKARLKGDTWKVEEPSQVISDETSLSNCLIQYVYSAADLQWKENFEGESLAKIQKVVEGLKGPEAAVCSLVDENGVQLAKFRLLLSGKDCYAQSEGSANVYLLTSSPLHDWEDTFQRIIPIPEPVKDEPSKAAKP